MVTWVNKDETAHTVTSNNGLFDENIQGGDSFSYTFNDMSTFNYTCTLHANMDGAVIVEEDSGDSGGY